ncbi:MAG: aldo/keto reductase, partial [Chloroflexota bacterium]
MINERILGRSGIKVSAMGLGCWAVGGPWNWQQPGEEGWPAGWGYTDDAESIKAIETALNMGVNFFDTAANYGAGHSETLLGKALVGKRDQVVIATKFGHVIDEGKKIVYGDESVISQNIQKDCENSLRRLNTDRIDIYQLHEGGMSKKLVPAMIEELEKLVASGKIRWYGWSTDILNRAEAMLNGAHMATVQFALNV